MNAENTYDISNSEIETQETPSVVEGANLEAIEKQFKKCLASLPSTSLSVQIMIYGFDCPSEELDSDTESNYEDIIEVDLAVSTRTQLLQQSITQFLIDAPKYEEGLTSDESTEDTIATVTNEVRGDVARLRSSLNDFAENIETAHIVKENVTEIFSTLLQSQARTVWGIVTAMLNVKKQRNKTKEDQSFEALNAIVSEVQWELSTRPVPAPAKNAPKKPMVKASSMADVKSINLD